MDSATLLWHLLAAGDEVKALTVDYGQRHRREIDSAVLLAKCAGVPHDIADLSGLRRLLSGSALTDGAVAVPHGHYAEESMKLTVVPNRNMILLAVAIGHAVSLGFGAVSYGAHSGDHAIYPDCREVFASAMNTAAMLCDWQEIRLVRPFIGMTKGEIARLGGRLGVPFHLTWTCYEGGELPCGKCGACVERREAFEFAGIEDPLR